MKLLKTQKQNIPPMDAQLEHDTNYLKYLIRATWPVFRRVFTKKLVNLIEHKWHVILVTLVFISMSLSLTSVIYNKYSAEPIHITTSVETDTVVEEVEIYVSNLKTYDEFLYAVGYTESRNNWSIVSDGGMLGRFQFNPNTLRGIGISVPQEYFLQDTMLQLVAFKRLLFLNKSNFQKYITQWSGKPLPQDERYIMTESGILMAFHLKPSGAIKYFESGCIDNSDTDGNGTPVSTYIKKFSGYKLK